MRGRPDDDGRSEVDDEPAREQRRLPRGGAARPVAAAAAGVAEGPGAPHRGDRRRVALRRRGDAAAAHGHAVRRRRQEGGVEEGVGLPARRLRPRPAGQGPRRGRRVGRGAVPDDRAVRVHDPRPRAAVGERPCVQRLAGGDVHRRVDALRRRRDDPGAGDRHRRRGDRAGREARAALGDAADAGARGRAVQPRPLRPGVGGGGRARHAGQLPRRHRLVAVDRARARRRGRELRRGRASARSARSRTWRRRGCSSGTRSCTW